MVSAVSPKGESTLDPQYWESGVVQCVHTYSEVMCIRHYGSNTATVLSMVLYVHVRTRVSERRGWAVAGWQSWKNQLGHQAESDGPQGRASWARRKNQLGHKE